MDGGRRYLVYGAGAVGAALGGLLCASGREVVLIARGAQLAALSRGGLTLALPSGEIHVDVPVVPGPPSIRFSARDVVLLCMKSQDTVSALEELARHAPQEVSVVCAQNGVNNERLAASLFSRVYGMVVYAPLQHLQPGHVSVHSEPIFGGLDLGRHPQGTDDLVTDLARDLVAAGFDARAEPRIERLKYGKLLSNVGNALQALGGRAALDSPLLPALQAEAVACYQAAGIDFAPLAELHARNASVCDLPVAGAPRGGGSSWQSLARGTGTIESDALNGEIARLGERFGVPTPCNHAIVALAERAARERWPPEHLALADLVAAVSAGARRSAPPPS